MDSNAASPISPGKANMVDEVVPQEGESSNLRTFVRVKRHIDEDPATTLILSFKRQKCDGAPSVPIPESYEVVNSVLKFAGSIQPEQKIETFVKTLDNLCDSSAKESLPKIFPIKPSFASNSARRLKSQQEAKQKSSACRYKIINTRRGLVETAESTESNENEDSNYLYSMFDLVNDGDVASQTKSALDPPKDDVITCNGAPMVVVKNSAEYVFDVYTVSTPLKMEGEHVSVEHFWESTENCLEPPESDDERNGHDQEDSDSNDENHRGNDYPDEESEASDGCYGYDQDEFYDSDDGEANGGGAGKMSGSKAMKELAMHVKTLQLGGYSSKYADASDEEFGGVYGETDEEDFLGS